MLLLLAVDPFKEMFNCKHLINLTSFSLLRFVHFRFLGSNRLEMIPRGAFSNLNSRSNQVM